jgi:superfamily II DNA/RNA helicase
LVPALEALWRQRWSQGDGLGALVVVPTRELAIQIFDVLRGVGKHHSVSAGLLIGGKKEFLEEQKKVVGMSLLVATPGRLLQHLEQTPGFDTSNLQVETYCYIILDFTDSPSRRARFEDARERRKAHIHSGLGRPCVWCCISSPPPQTHLNP